MPKSRGPRGNSAHHHHHHAGGRKRVPKDDEGICRHMLNLLKEQDDAWPFLEPVGRKSFPEYHKVIKKPMDLQTMGSKLMEGK